MDSFATLHDADRKNFFQEATARKHYPDIVIEKDFWVCWTLKCLFINPALSPYLTFKGGTSLSKAYGLIERFSEDIDLTISHDAPFLKDSKDATEDGISNNERKRRIEALKENAQSFVRDVALPALQSDIETLLGPAEAWKIVLDTEDPDLQTILFYYPKVFDYNINFGEGGFGEGLYGGNTGYIRPHIKLEFGARGEIEPNETRGITPYVTELLPDIFENPTIEVAVLTAERTFWEKATILHAQYHGSKMRDRMSRHYYDTYMLIQRGVAEEALKMPELLESVVRNKSLMFRNPKASYDTAVIGSLKLTPTPEQKEILKADYGKMVDMFIGEYPDFDVMMDGIDELQEKV